MKLLFNFDNYLQRRSRQLPLLSMQPFYFEGYCQQNLFPYSNFPSFIQTKEPFCFNIFKVWLFLLHQIFKDFGLTKEILWILKLVLSTVNKMISNHSRNVISREIVSDQVPQKLFESFVRSWNWFKSSQLLFSRIAIFYFMGFVSLVWNWKYLISTLALTGWKLDF